jgi:hypothetical protein
MRPRRISAAPVTVDLEAQRILPRLDPLLERIIDDAQVRHLGDLPLFTGIGTGDAFASAGIFDIAAAVPFEPPDIQSMLRRPVPRWAWPRPSRRLVIDIAAALAPAPPTASW